MTIFSTRSPHSKASLPIQLRGKQYVSQRQPIPTTKSGTSPTSLGKQIEENNGSQSITRDELNKFLDDVSVAIAEGPKDGEPLPEIEADLKVISHFNKAGMKEWNKTYCFIYHNVKVYETGKKEHAKRMERMTIEEKVFGGHRF
jgi:hypothetical protein